MRETNLIQTEGVTKIYNAHQPDEIRALEGISLHIAPGETTVFKGPSGSGKTSLLSLIGCMARPTSGRVIVRGKDVAKLPERFLTQIRRRTFGFIFQQFNLIRKADVLENVTLPLFPGRRSFTEIRERAESLLDRFELTGKRHRKVHQLSGGEQQRVAIARALINNPEVLIADEPTAHLDRKLAEDLVEILSSLHREGKTVIMATHDPFLYDHPFVNRIIEIQDGRIEGALPS
ncbi:MAG: ABC transporter ATP-binding protein [Deltaproteobacteria bacterium]|nr:ABC transporter ATP-binding protein [Deltaproteobacteria bacterium]